MYCSMKALVNLAHAWLAGDGGFAFGGGGAD
jgi:hypothetical protein